MTEETTTTETTETTTEQTVDTTTSAPEGEGTAPDTSAEESDDTVLGGGEQEAKDDSTSEDDDGEKSEDETTEEEAPEGPPETYELSLKAEDGSDVPLDAEMVEKADEVFRELNLTNDQANKLLPMAQEMLGKGQEAAMQQLLDAGAQQKKAWLEEYQASDIGGAKASETEAKAAQALEGLGFSKGHEFRKLLNDTGFGNNVHFIGAFAKIGEMLSEDGNFPVPDQAGEKEVVGHASLYKD